MVSSFLVTSATGQQGGATARILLKNNVTVHALVRNTSSEAAKKLQQDGVILFEGDFDDVDAIKAATAGVTGIFLNPFPNKTPGVEIRQAQNFITAAIAAKSVTTLVLSTAYWTGDREIWDINDKLRNYYIPKAAIEEAVKTAGFQNYTILRPSWLMHNYLLPDSHHHFPELATEAVLAHGYEAQARMPHLDAGDVGQFAAAALLNPAKFNSHEIELGFGNLTVVETARHLSEASGVHVEVRKRSDEELALNKISTLMFQLRTNLSSVDIDGEKLQKDYGIRLTSFAEYLQREKEWLINSLPKQK